MIILKPEHRTSIVTKYPIAFINIITTKRGKNITCNTKINNDKNCAIHYRNHCLYFLERRRDPDSIEKSTKFKADTCKY